MARPSALPTLVVLGTLLGQPPFIAHAATPCEESELAPFYPLDSPALDPERAKVSVSAPIPTTPWHIYLDELPPDERLATAEAALRLLPSQLRSGDSWYTDVGIIEATVTGLQQSLKGLATYLLELDVLSVWPRRGMAGFEPGRAAAVVMEGEFRECPDRATVYHPYPCIGDTVLALITAGGYFAPCAETWPQKWILLARLQETEKRALRELAQELVRQPEEPERPTERRD